MTPVVTEPAFDRYTEDLERYQKEAGERPVSTDGKEWLGYTWKSTNLWLQ